MNRDYYARLNKQISQVQPDGTKKVMEKSWFTRGTMLMVNGYKKSGLFLAKSYKNDVSHQVYKITGVNGGDIDTIWQRWGEETV